MTYQIYLTGQSGITNAGTFGSMDAAIRALFSMLLQNGSKAVLVRGTKELMTRTVKVE